MDAIEYTGPLMPGEPGSCYGNGRTATPDGNAVYECSCDNCDYFLECFPAWEVTEA